MIQNSRSGSCDIRVTFDPQTFLRQRTGGISRLFTDLVKEFDVDPGLGVHALLPFRHVNNAYVANELPHRHLQQSPQWLPREVLYAPWVLRGLSVPRNTDVVHHTYYSRRFLGSTGRALRACTVYDMIPETFVGTPSFTGSHLAKREYVHRSDLVICISEATREDMVHFLGQPSGHVVVIPCAVGPGFSPDHEPVESLPPEYLLYVGKRAGYKDFEILPTAMAQLARKGVELPVVVVGRPFSAEEQELLSREGVRSTFTQVQLAEGDLKRAYANCAVLVQTSRYEGFGMTPLEAMASGAPVVIANASAMPEVGGDVARYFEPGDPESLAATLEGLLTDEALRHELGSLGFERAKYFTTRAMAERTAVAYQDVLRA